MYDEIVSRYYNVILNYCKYKLNGNKTAAEDITQEVFFVLYRKRNHLKMGDNIKTVALSSRRQSDKGIHKKESVFSAD